MKKIELSSEELEMMNYNDIAFLILEKNGKKMKIIDLYKEVSKILQLDPDNTDHITDLFELLSTDKRFIMLEEGYWDLRIKHNKGMVIDQDEEEDEDLVLEEEAEEEDYDDTDEKEDETDDVDDDDLSDLVIIDDVDDEANM